MTNEDLTDLERRVAELKTLYDNFAAGLEKREPLQRREQLAAELRRLTGNPGNSNTQLAFRFNNLKARFATMEQHWNKLVRLIEERGRKRVLGDAPPPVSAPVAQAHSAAEAAKRSLEEATLRAVYAKYVASRAQTGEATVSYEAMVSSLKKQVPLVVEKFKCKSVEFKVLQKDGKTVLKAVPVS